MDERKKRKRSWPTEKSYSTTLKLKEKRVLEKQSQITRNKNISKDIYKRKEKEEQGKDVWFER